MTGECRDGFAVRKQEVDSFQCRLTLPAFGVHNSVNKVLKIGFPNGDTEFFFIIQFKKKVFINCSNIFWGVEVSCFCFLSSPKRGCVMRENKWLLFTCISTSNLKHF